MNPFITQGMIMFILLFLYTLYLWLHTCHFSFLDFYLDIILYMRLLQISSRMSPVHQSEAWMENVRYPVQKSGIAWNIQNDIFNIELYWYRINTDPQKCVWCSPVSKNCDLCVLLGSILSQIRYDIPFYESSERSERPSEHCLCLTHPWVRIEIET